MNKKYILIELAGWYGTAAILLAYTLVSFNMISAHGSVFQLLNLTGALATIVIMAHKKVLQSIILNMFWAGVALIALFRSF